MDRGRGTAKDRGYDSQWERVALERRQLDMYLCQTCLKDDCVTSSNIVDHIVPIHVRPDWRVEIGNTQVLCNGCHSRKTSDDLRLYGGRTQRQFTREQFENRNVVLRMTTPPRDV